jgi:hypothetical protein
MFLGPTHTFPATVNCISTYYGGLLEVTSVSGICTRGMQYQLSYESMSTFSGD